MSRIRADILKAALWLEQEARDLRVSHTVTGRWPKVLTDPDDQRAKALCAEWRDLAKRLRAAAQVMA